MIDQAIQGMGGATGVIQRTCIRIDQLEVHFEGKRRERYARRNKIRYIDDLLNEFELLNLAEEEEIPTELYGKAKQFIVEEAHPLCARPECELRIADWMEALYDVQDTLMVPLDDDLD